MLTRGLIKCEPFGGWGNRLITISSAYRLAKMYDRDFEVGWAVMEGVISKAPVSIYKLPFPVYLLDSPPHSPECKPLKYGRFFFTHDQLSQPMLRLTGGDEESYYNFLLHESDLVGLDDLKLNRLNNEIRNSLYDILVPQHQFLESMSSCHVMNQNCLGVHLRVAIEDDIAKGFQHVWPSFDIDFLIVSIISCVRDCGADIVYLVSPDDVLVREVQKRLVDSSIPTLVSADIPQFSFLDRDSVLYSEFYLLTKCKWIARRAASTFSAVASLFGSGDEYIFNEPNGIIKRRATVLGGFGL
jgi:hypothetical protein